ncbi:MAG: Smr/MutS family protein [Candidatus Krumholzibacteria bacterium]|nr:Smr/MutS family protein [Candidatus Krumholzibacteria bacterium]
MSAPPRETPFVHAARTLELDAVLDLVASRCVNDGARAAVRALFPLADAGAIAEALAAVEELRYYSAEEGDIPVASTEHRAYVEALARRAAGPAPEVLWRLAQSERAAADLRRRLEGREDTHPRLAAMAARIVPDAALVKAVEAAVDADGTVRDDASPLLARLRREIRDLRASLRSLAERLVSEYGEDTLGTVLGSRHVLVVPRSRVSRQSGLVHAASHSGGSLYYEPAPLVERNNELETRVGDESAEVSRILEALAERVRAARDRLLANADAVDAFDALRAKAAFAKAFRCTTPSPSTDGRLRLVRARHPLLEAMLAAAGDRELVALDLTLEPGGRLLVISGPNAGGKTVALRTAGVCALMFQCGLQVPCDTGSQLPVFARVLVDIGDEQSMASSLSTFTSHLRHLDAMTRLAGADTLCLIDEIGDGTDPDEGAALAVATLERLLASRAAVIATTHFGRIKAFALKTDGVSNASMAFEDAEGRPLYRLLQGVAGRSRGLDTARRTGFDADIVARAQSFLGEEAHKLDAVLAALEANTLSLERAREQAEAHEAALRREIAAYQEKAAAYDLTRRQAQRRALEEAEGVLVAARGEVERIVQTIRERQADKQAIREGRARLRSLISEVRARLVPPEEAPRLTHVSVGQWVAVSATGHPAGRVIDVENGRATVEIDGKRIKLPIEKLHAASPPGAADSSGAASYDIQHEPLTSTSVDVRGHDREDALAALQRFVDQALLAGVHEVTVIHGVGRGVLARAVRQHLRDDPRVAELRPGQPPEGGDGVTVVRFK